jgi:tetratricopeptide (TPR) repeat protein
MIENRRMAVAEAWSALCESARSGRGETSLEAHLAASALKGLAVALCDRERDLTDEQRTKEHRRALHLLGRAVALAPHDAAIRFALGDAAKDSDRQRAIAEMDEALRIDPTRPKYWRELALLHAENVSTENGGEAAHAVYCCRQALQLLDCYEHSTPTETEWTPQPTDDEEPVSRTLNGVAKTYETLGADHMLEVKRVERMVKVVTLCKEEDPAKVDRAKLERIAAGRDDWAAGQAHVALGRHDLHAKHYKAAEEQFEAALKKLHHFPEEIVRRDVRIGYAQTLQRLDPPKHDRALEELRRAIGEDPLHSAPREALADAYSEIHDYKQAERVLRDALRWDPDRPILHRKLGRCRWKLAQDCRTAPLRREALLRAVASFRRALELSEHHTLDVQLVSHYWLARLHKELGEYDRAIPYLRRATICKEGQPLIRLLLGEAYIRAHAYDAAEDELEDAIAAVNLQESDYGRFFEDTGWPPGRVKAYAHTLVALGYAERGVSPPRGKDPVKQAQAAIAAARKRKHATAPPLDATEAACDYVDGLFALGRHESKRRDGLNAAIKCFSRSLGLFPQSETYVGIARACMHKIETGGVLRRSWIERGEDACRNAIELDVTGRFARQAEALLTEFAEARRQPPPPVRKRRRKQTTTPPPRTKARPKSRSGGGRKTKRDLEKTLEKRVRGVSTQQPKRGGGSGSSSR